MEGCSEGRCCFGSEEVRWTEGAGYEHLRRCQKVNAVLDAAMSAYVGVGWSLLQRGCSIGDGGPRSAVTLKSAALIA